MRKAVVAILVAYQFLALGSYPTTETKPDTLRISAKHKGQTCDFALPGGSQYALRRVGLTISSAAPVAPGTVYVTVRANREGKASNWKLPLRLTEVPGRYEVKIPREMAYLADGVVTLEYDKLPASQAIQSELEFAR